MIRITTGEKYTTRAIVNPNDSLDFISSFERELNTLLSENNEKHIKKIKITFGASKVSSEQNTSEYLGVEGNAYVMKKALAGGDQGYFSDNRDRKVYAAFKDGKKIEYKNFDNHIKIRFRCRTAVEREVLRTFLVLVLTFKTKHLNCLSADLDYISDLETIQNEMFVLDLFIHARTSLKWSNEYDSEELKTALIVGNEDVVGIVKEEKTPKDEEDLENGFF